MFRPFNQSINHTKTKANANISTSLFVDMRLNRSQKKMRHWLTKECVALHLQSGNLFYKRLATFHAKVLNSDHLFFFLKKL